MFLSCRALDPELHAELTKGGRQIAWRFLRRMFKLFDRAGEGLGVGVDDTERLFQVCATSDQDILQVHISIPGMQSVAQHRLLGIVFSLKNKVPLCPEI